MGISVDSSWAHRAFREKLGITIPLLSDFEPKGEVIRRYGAYLESPGHGNRSLVLIDEEGVVRWVHESPTPLEIPGANLIFDAWRRRLTSASRSARRHERTSPAPSPGDRSRGPRPGRGPEAVVYLDLACPHCAAVLAPDRASCPSAWSSATSRGRQAPARAGPSRRGRGGGAAGRRAGFWAHGGLDLRDQGEGGRSASMGTRARDWGSTWSDSSVTAARSRSLGGCATISRAGFGRP